MTAVACAVHCVAAMRTMTLVFLGLSGLAACAAEPIRTGGDDDSGDDDVGDDDGADLPDAAPVSNRVTEDLAVLYRFDGTAGQATVADISGVGDPLDLTIADPAAVIWGVGYATLATPTLIATAGPATKVTSACKGADEMTVEAWVKPAVDASNGRVVASSIGTSRNFQLKQQNTAWVSRVRTSLNPTGASPELATNLDTATIAVTTPRHLVSTRIAGGSQVNYVDNVKQPTVANTGTFVVWDDTYNLSVGSDGDGANPWAGDVYLVAVYCRALTDAEVALNYGDGPTN
jgi:hypothetical protein